MVEFKNEELVNTMQSLQKVNSTAKKEKVNRILAETQRDFAEEAAKVNQQMKEILDLISRKLFVVNKDLMVESTSNCCEKIFGEEIANQKLGTILNFKQAEMEKHFALGLEQVFEDFMPESVNVSLLPKVIEISNNRIVEFTYTVIGQNEGE